MKVGVIAANGRLGSRIVEQALDRNMEVTAFVRNGVCSNMRATSIEKNVFDLTREDIQGLDVVMSAFGSGFSVDPTVNKDVFIKYIELFEKSHTKLITIAGAGSLYTDATKKMYEYESESHPEKLRDISKNTRFGIDELYKNKTFPWTVVCPSRVFDFNGCFSKEYLVGENEHIIYNEDKKSYVTYDDLAYAMLDIAQNDLYSHQIITIASKKGGV